MWRASFDPLSSANASRRLFWHAKNPMPTRYGCDVPQWAKQHQRAAPLPRSLLNGKFIQPRIEEHRDTSGCAGRCADVMRFWTLPAPRVSDGWRQPLQGARGFSRRGILRQTGSYGVGPCAVRVSRKAIAGPAFATGAGPHALRFENPFPSLTMRHLCIKWGSRDALPALGQCSRELFPRTHSPHTHRPLGFGMSRNGGSPFRVMYGLFSLSTLALQLEDQK